MSSSLKPGGQPADRAQPARAGTRYWNHIPRPANVVVRAGARCDHDLAAAVAVRQCQRRSFRIRVARRSPPIAGHQDRIEVKALLGQPTKYLRPVTSETETGRVIVTGTVLSRGARTALSQAQLTDARGRLLAHATSTCLIS